MSKYQIDKKRLTKLVNDIVNSSKPSEVVKIDTKLFHISKNEFYLDVTYVLPDDNGLMSIHNMHILENLKLGWNVAITKTLKGFLNIEVIINNTGVTSESYYNKK